MAKEGRNELGHFAPGNRLWEARSTAGPKPRFKDPEPLWEACVEYFTWVADNPLLEAKPFAYEGNVTIADVPKLRAMTIGGLCIFLDIDLQTWVNWRNNRSDLLDVVTRVETIIRTQKFEGASAGLFVPMIIARDLGLANKEELSGPDGGPVEVTASPSRRLAEKVDAIAGRKTIE